MTLSKYDLAVLEARAKVDAADAAHVADRGDYSGWRRVVEALKAQGQAEAAREAHGRRVDDERRRRALQRGETIASV